MKQDMIVILDLGSTENTVLAREIRELGVYSEIHPHDITEEEIKALDNVKGILFDSAVPGSGKSFDWSMLERLPKNQKMLFLAGGLTADNVAKAVAQLRPFAVDVSSGVELADKSGKDFELVRTFIENARNSK